MKLILIAIIAQLASFQLSAAAQDRMIHNGQNIARGNMDISVSEITFDVNGAPFMVFASVTIAAANISPDGYHQGFRLRCTSDTDPSYVRTDVDRYEIGENSIGSMTRRHQVLLNEKNPPASGKVTCRTRINNPSPIVRYTVMNKQLTVFP